MGTKLNQIIAVVNGKKNSVQRELTDVYKKVQKSDLFSGIDRSYQPSDDDGETFPPEHKKIQYSASNAIKDVTEVLSDLYNTVATQDYGNTKAVADVVVDGKPILSDVPVTHLLYLEKSATDIRTFVNSLPTLDPAEEWEWSDIANCYQSRPAKTNKTKKVYRNHVLYEATKEHPAQVEPYTEDIKVGEWKTIKFSGAMPASDKKVLLERVNKLIDAIKKAREEANMTEVDQVNVSDKLFGYLFSEQVK